METAEPYREDSPTLRRGGPVTDEPAGDTRCPVIVTLADVQPEAVEWLWQGYIPRGKLTILEGDPGVGKTWLALAISAHVSRGTPRPGGTSSSEPADVLYMQAEDGPADTLRPRLNGLGAVVGRIHVLTGWQSETDQGEITLADI